MIDKEETRFKALVTHKHNIIKYGSFYVDWLLQEGKFDDAKNLARHLFIHDDSKFFGIEWEHLWRDEPEELFEKAKKHHWEHNSHHPEWWQSNPDSMRDTHILEMVADWYSRFIENDEESFYNWLLKAEKRYKFSHDVWAKIIRYANKLIELISVEGRDKNSPK